MTLASGRLRFAEYELVANPRPQACIFDTFWAIFDKMITGTVITTFRSRCQNNIREMNCSRVAVTTKHDRSCIDCTAWPRYGVQVISLSKRAGTRREIDIVELLGTVTESDED